MSLKTTVANSGPTGHSSLPDAGVLMQMVGSGLATAGSPRSLLRNLLLQAEVTHPVSLLNSVSFLCLNENLHQSKCSKPGPTTSPSYQPHGENDLTIQCGVTRYSRGAFKVGNHFIYFGRA